MPRDSSKILQEVSYRELGLRLHSPCVLFPAPWGLSHAQARLSRGPVTPKDSALKRRVGKSRISPWISTVSFSSCVTSKVPWKVTEGLTSPFLSGPGQEKPEAGSEVLKQGSYLSAEGCRAGRACLHCNHCPPGPH